MRKTATKTKARQAAPKPSRPKSTAPSRTAAGARALVIVESPTKAKTIDKILSGQFNVMTSMGHVRDLPKKKLSVDIEHGFTPTYETLEKKQKVLADLKKAAAGAKTVYLATDFDREGEAIAWHLAEALHLKKGQYHRITFHEITPEAIQEALGHPRELDSDLIEAQQARRILDRIVGYKLSPFLWNKVKRGLSAGRVQSVAVRLLVEREMEIEKFTPQEYWTVLADVARQTGSGAGEPFEASLSAVGGKKLDKLALSSKEESDRILAGLANAAWRVAEVEKKEKRRHPAPPFTTSTLQQAAVQSLRYSAARTMALAQQLYEAGHITYMRTDSLNVAKSAQEEALGYVRTTYGADFLPPSPRIYKTKSKGAQEAHEAIRPTAAQKTPDSMKGLQPPQAALYALIWQRFVASQMADAVLDTVGLDIAAADCTFRATGQTVKFPGFLSVYHVEEEGDEKEESSRRLPPCEKGETLDLKALRPEQHFTEPPPRYSEATLIKTLEKYGIGRPSTFAPTIQTIVARGYVAVRERRLHPLPMGRAVTELLVEHFESIVDYEFTAKLEEELDLVAEGKANRVAVLSRFCKTFLPALKTAEKTAKYVRVRSPMEATNEICKTCGHPMVIRTGRFGRFLSCSRYPECPYKVTLDRQDRPKAAPIATDLVCEKCGKPFVVRTGRRGRFLACTGFPKCRNTRNVPPELEATLPPPLPQAAPIVSLGPIEPPAPAGKPPQPPAPPPTVGKPSKAKVQRKVGVRTAAGRAGA